MLDLLTVVCKTSSLRVRVCRHARIPVVHSSPPRWHRIPEHRWPARRLRFTACHSNVGSLKVRFARSMGPNRCGRASASKAFATVPLLAKRQHALSKRVAPSTTQPQHLDDVQGIRRHKSSSPHHQHFGICQKRSMSPFLFVMVTTILIRDAEAALRRRMLGCARPVSCCA